MANLYVRYHHILLSAEFHYLKLSEPSIILNRLRSFDYLRVGIITYTDFWSIGSKNINFLVCSDIYYLGKRFSRLTLSSRGLGSDVFWPE